MDNFTGQTMLRAFIGGTEDDPMVMLYDGGYGLTMFDLLSGSERWTITIGNCDLGDAAAVAVDDEGTMYITGSGGPDLVAVTQEGRILWKADTEDAEISQPREIKLKKTGIEVTYEDPETGSQVVTFDYMGDLISVQAAGH